MKFHNLICLILALLLCVPGFNEISHANTAINFSARENAAFEKTVSSPGGNCYSGGPISNFTDGKISTQAYTHGVNDSNFKVVADLGDYYDVSLVTYYSAKNDYSYVEVYLSSGTDYTDGVKLTRLSSSYGTYTDADGNTASSIYRHEYAPSSNTKDVRYVTIKFNNYKWGYYLNELYVTGTSTGDQPDDDLTDEIYYSASDASDWSQYCTQTMNKYRFDIEDPGLVSDEEYFGVYDTAGGKWVKESLLDYERCSGLSDVCSFVMANDYTSAKSELLKYYQSKFSAYTFPVQTADKLKSVLQMNNIYGTSAIDIEKITTEKKRYEFDITNSISVSSRLSKMAFTVGAVNKDGIMALFASVNSESNKPYIKLTTSGGVITLYPISDATIHSGSLESESFASDSTIEVCESYSSIKTGSRRNKYTSRGAFLFDFGSLAASDITEAKLCLYGYALESDDPETPLTNKDFCDVFVSVNGNVNWSDSDASWESVLGAGGGYVSYDRENISPVLQAGRNNANSWLELAKTYSATGDEIYAFHAIRWLVEALDKNELSSYDMHNLDNGNILKDTLQGLAFVIGSEHMTPNNFAIILKWIYKMTEHACKSWAYQHELNNFGQANASGLFLVSRVFTEYRVCDDPVYDPEPRFDGDHGKDGGWIQLGEYRVKYCYVKDMFADGSCTEVPLSYVHYLNYLIRMVLEWQDYLHYDITEIFDENFNENNLKNYELFMLKYSNPVFGCWQQGHDDVYNRNLSGGSAYTLKSVEDPQLRYFSTNRNQGEPPSQKSYIFDQSVRAVLRSDWSKNAVAAQINANGGDLNSHGQQDDLSLNIFGYGQALIQEPTHKDYNYNTDSVSAWLASSKSINAVEINNKTQRGAHSFVPYTEFGEDIQGSPKGEPGSISPDKAELNDMYNFLHAESEAYKKYEALGDDFTYIRDVLFVEPEFFIVVDYIEPLNDKSRSNTYKQYWHFLPEAGITLASDGSVRTNFADTANIIVAPVQKSNAFTPNIKTGYWANGSNWMYADYARYDKIQSGTATFNTVLYPVKKGESYDVRTENIILDITEEKANAFKFETTDETTGATDTTTFYTLFDESLKADRKFSDFSTDGTLSLITENESGFKRAILRNGTSIEKGNTKIISSKSEISDLGITWNANSIELHTSKNVYTSKTKDEETTKNLVLSKGKSSSGSLDGGNHTLAFDGDMTTGWQSSYDKEDCLIYPSIEADFGGTAAFSKVNIFTSGDSQFNIYRSDNGTDWEYVGITSDGGERDGKKICTLECSVQKANYIRAAYAEKTAPVVYEFEVYEASSKSIMLDDISIYCGSKPSKVTLNGKSVDFEYSGSCVTFRNSDYTDTEPAQKDFSSGDNIAQGKNVYVHSGNKASKYPIESFVDGDVSSIVYFNPSNGGHNVRVAADLGKNYEVNEATVYLPSNRNITEMYLSKDSVADEDEKVNFESSFETIDGITYAVMKFDSYSKECRYVIIEYVNPNFNYGYQICELYVAGTDPDAVKVPEAGFYDNIVTAKKITEECTLIVAMYDNHKLNGLESYRISEDFRIDISDKIPDNTSDIKIMLWKKGTLIPLCRAQ